MAVPRETGNENVVTAREQIARYAIELRGARAHPVDQDEGTLGPVGMEGRNGAPHLADAGMIASDKPLETLKRGSQEKVLKRHGVYLLSERDRELIADEERYGARNYAPLDVVVERAAGVWLWDVNGKRYLDCVSAYSAMNLGHCHPRVHAALVEQAGRVTLTSRALRNDRMPGFLKKL